MSGGTRWSVDEVEGHLDDRKVPQTEKVIFNRPRSSTPCISYCVTMGASAGSAPGSGCAGRAGTRSRSWVMTTAAACMPSWAAEALEALGDVDHELRVRVLPYISRSSAAAT